MRDDAKVLLVGFPWDVLPGFFEKLQAFLPVKFILTEPAAAASYACNGAILHDGCAQQVRHAFRTVPVLIVRAACPLVTTAEAVQFSRHASLPSFFRDRLLPLHSSERVFSFDCDSKFSCLASVSGQTVWACSRSSLPPGGSELVTSLPPPDLEMDGYLFQVFNGERYLNAFPYFDFVKRSVLRQPFTPTIPACIIIDDPNLHWTSYGALSFRKLLYLAGETGAHFSLAMVPLDAWFAFPPAVRLFREGSASLSLMIHGHLHEKQELGQSRSCSEWYDRTQRAMLRILRFERDYHLQIDRVLAPPHGVCSEAALASFASFGVRGVTTNRWSLWKNISLEARRPDIGLTYGDALAGGQVCVLNRFRLNSSIALSEALNAAYLGKPIVPYGHHLDFARGMVQVRRLVDEINSIPGVVWGRPEQMIQGVPPSDRSAELSLAYSRSISLADIPPVTRRFTSELKDRFVGLLANLTHD